MWCIEQKLLLRGANTFEYKECYFGGSDCGTGFYRQRLSYCGVGEEGDYMKMRHTQGVSYPRSGHGVIFHLAKHYFGDAFVYCSPGGSNKMHCGCKSVPCVNPGRTFSKNHDFGLRKSAGISITLSERYFIQYRNSVRSIASDFYLYRSNNPDKVKQADWENFARNSVAFWNRFVDKWVLNFPLNANESFHCKYEDLIANPEDRVREVLSFLSDEPLDDNLVAQILKKNLYPHSR